LRGSGKGESSIKIRGGRKGYTLNVKTCRKGKLEFGIVRGGGGCGELGGVVGGGGYCGRPRNMVGISMTGVLTDRKVKRVGRTI